MSATLFIVDDEPAITDMLSLAFELAGFRVQIAHNGIEAWQKLQDQTPDLLILDWMLPGLSGIELAHRIRHSPELKTLPIIMLTAKNEEESKILGLESGADDYVTKPFSTRELISRSKAVLRRLAPQTLETQLQHHELTLEPLSQRVKAGEQNLNLSSIEFKLLECFMRNPDRVFSREQLLNRVWGSTVYIEDRTVDVHILRLRKALKSVNLSHLIETVRGAGYRLKAAS